MLRRRNKEGERESNTMSWQAVAAVWVAMAMCAAAFIGNYKGITLVPTPYGWRPKQCVHSWPSGTAIREVEGKNHTHITLPNGTEVILRRLPECMREYIGPDGLSHTRVQAGWLDNAGNYTNRGGDTYAPCSPLP